MKNNIKALWIHIFINIISLFIAICIHFPQWDSSFIYKLIATSVTILGILSYLKMGSLMQDKGNWIKNIVSVSMIWFIGVLLWILCYLIIKHTVPASGGYHMERLIWFIYIIYYENLFLTVSVFCKSWDSLMNNLPLIFLPISFLPTILFWIGMELRKGFSST